jgi:glutaredoxin
VLAIWFAAAGAGDIHTWRDAQGRVHFADRPPADVATEIVSVKPNVYESPSIEALGDALEPSPTVVLYSASWCGVCKQARRYFDAQDIAYTEYDVETSTRGKRDFARLEAHGVPVILVGRERMNGFDRAAFNALYRRHRD